MPSFPVRTGPPPVDSQRSNGRCRGPLLDKVGDEPMVRKTASRSGTGSGQLTAMPAISERAVLDLAQVFKLMSDETRLRILLYLAQSGELHVTDLCNRLGQSQPAVSHHLALLRVAALIEARREGKHNYYSVRGDHFGELMTQLFSSTGAIPRRIRFHDFVLMHEGS